MGYVESNLLPNEKVMLKGRLHWAVFVSPIALFILSFLVAAFEASLPSQGGADNANAQVGYAFICGSIVGLFAIMALLRAVTTYFSTEFAVTDRRIIAKAGLLRRHSLELMMSKVESISVNQSIGGRMFGYGTIVVAGSGGTKEGFPSIADPQKLRQQINAQIAAISN